MVNIEDSKAMKRLSYITKYNISARIIYGCKDLVASRRTDIDISQGVFGMNVIKLNSGTYGTLAHYVAAALPFTCFTIWIIVAFQSRFVLREDETM